MSKKTPNDFLARLKELEKSATVSDKKESSKIKFEDVDSDDDDDHITDQNEAKIKPKPEKIKSKPNEKSNVNTNSKEQQVSSAKLFGNNDIDLNTIDMLTRKLAQELGGDDLFDSDTDDDDDLDDTSDAEFRKNLLQEFKNLNNSGKNDVPSKARLKQLYLELLQTGPALMQDKNVADNYLSKLSSSETTAIIDILQKEPDQIISFFGNDPQVIEAVRKVPTLSTSQKSNQTGTGLWQDLKEEDLEDSDEDENEANLREKASDAVKDALNVFEENIVLYAQHPGKLMQLASSLTDRDQHIFLDIIFREYTPDKMNEKLKAMQTADKQKQNQPQQPPPPQIDSNLVAHVFKEVLTHFKAYKKYPEKFKPLTDRLNPLEREAFEALVKAFWDVKAEQIKI